jgi:two-component system, OmpR family, alkaline phosphatase synthesis response regulator PhoP
MKLKDIRILIVDDEEDIREFIGIVLAKEGAIIMKAIDGNDAIDKTRESKPQLILMDKMMPKMNGIEASKKIKSDPKNKSIRIVMLSAIGDDASQIEGLEQGIDDYWVKPIKSELLISKIFALMRNQVSIEKNSLEYKHIFIDKTTYQVTLNKSDIISLPRKEFELLFLLMSEPDQVFRREEILEKVWGTDVIIGDRTIDVHIRKIREKIGDEYFKTIKGIGYKFVAF